MTFKAYAAPEDVSVFQHLANITSPKYMSKYLSIVWKMKDNCWRS